MNPLVRTARYVERSLIFWNATGLARRVLGAALYGDYRPADRLTNKAHTLTPAVLIPLATVWADAYLGDAPAPKPGDPYVPEFHGPGPVTPMEQWLGDLIAARANGDDDTFAALLTGVAGPLVRFHLRALLDLAATARLALDDPEPTWP